MDLDKVIIWCKLSFIRTTRSSERSLVRRPRKKMVVWPRVVTVRMQKG